MIRRIEYSSNEMPLKEGGQIEYIFNKRKKNERYLEENYN